MNVTSITEILENEIYNVSNISNFSNGSNGLDCSSAPHQYGLGWRIGIITVAAIFSFLTVVGNIMVMISFKIDKQLQTISNYFLFSLAVADFAIGLISMPLFTMYTVLGYWPLGPHICDTWLALDYLASNASVLNLLIISFDRYLSVTRPLTYRAKRTTRKAFYMISGAWGISAILWPPWIYSWQYIEGQRTVPENSCYIQFIETNHYITVITAIAAFYIPVTIMVFLYWRIWQETEKRQKDLPNLQAGKQDASKRSNSRCDEALETEDCKRPRSESNTGEDSTNATHIAISFDKHHTSHRPFSWTWLKMWCIAWWHSGREDEDEDEEIAGPESSRTGLGYEETLTPLSLETPLPSTVSQCPSVTTIQTTEIATQDRIIVHEYTRRRPTDFSTKPSISNDSVYTILIKLPDNSGKFNERASIKMIHDDSMSIQLRSKTNDSDDGNGDSDSVCNTDKDARHDSLSVIRRPSTMPDIRIPLTNTKNIPKTGKGILNKQANKKKKLPEKKADRKAAKTLSAILLAFILTWTPYNILVVIKSITACTFHIPQMLWDFVYYLCYLNSTVNPMCYALCNAAFRRTYIRILKCKWHSRNRVPVMDRGYQ